MSKIERNFELCVGCKNPTNTLANLTKLNVDIIEDDGTKYFIGSEDRMGDFFRRIGTLITHNSEQKIWCGNCIVPTPNCGAPGCVSCKPGQIHYCDRCRVIGATHRARFCPCPKAR